MGGGKIPFEIPDWKIYKVGDHTVRHTYLEKETPVRQSQSCVLPTMYYVLEHSKFKPVYNLILLTNPPFFQPDLQKLERRLAAKGLKDPWIRNEVRRRMLIDET